MYFRFEKKLIMIGSSEIYRSVNEVITESCASEVRISAQANSLHKAILKKFFCAEKVEVLYEEKKVVLTVRVSATERTTLEIEYDHLNDFLNKCIDKSEKHIRFYQGLLQYYAMQNA